VEFPVGETKKQSIMEKDESGQQDLIATFEITFDNVHVHFGI
jgi:hypothetical protein